MSVPFTPIGNSIIAAYADDSTDTALTIEPGSLGLPNVLYCVNPDAANVVAVTATVDPLDHNAVIPQSGADGVGVIILPGGTAMIRVPQVPYIAGNVYVAVAGVSGTGNVYITPGVL